MTGFHIHLDIASGIGARVKTTGLAAVALTVDQLGMGQAGGQERRCCLNCSGKGVPENIQVIHEAHPSAEKESARSSSSQKAALPALISGPESKAASNGTDQDAHPLVANAVINDQAFDTAPFGTIDYEEMTKKQRQAAKHLVKDFVKTMVKGRQLSAVLTSGQIRTCFCALNRSLDKLQIRASEKDKQGRTIPLATIAEIVVGSDASQSTACDLETPLDDLSVTLVLDSDECITFSLPDIESRDHLAACLTMFSNQSRDLGKSGDVGKSG